jgi:hypothetical protein
MWEPGGPPERAFMALSRRLVMTHPAGDRGAGESDPERLLAAPLAAGGSFQHSDLLSEPLYSVFRLTACDTGSR